MTDRSDTPTGGPWPETPPQPTLRQRIAGWPLSGLGGSFDEIIANDNVEAGASAIVEISPGDRRFTTGGCGTWTQG